MILKKLGDSIWFPLFYKMFSFLDTKERKEACNCLPHCHYHCTVVRFPFLNVPTLLIITFLIH